jgi:CheY-like chemotaxis protein
MGCCGATSTCVTTKVVTIQNKKTTIRNEANSGMAYRAVVVEDDQDIQYLYKLKLEREGFEVAVANNGIEGLEVIEAFQPDIVLLDIMMPVMNGAEMLARMRSEDWGSNARVVILTNISKDEAPQALRFLHVDRYIVKAHHTPAQIVNVVHEILR